MRRAYRPMAVGVGLLLGAIAIDFAGTFFQSLPLLILSFASAVAGAVVAISGILEFVSERA
jgi:hypothetical protein